MSGVRGRRNIRLVVGALSLAAACLAVVAAGGTARAAGEGDVFLSIGILEYAEGNYREAIANFEKARQLDPRDVGAPYYLGLTHSAMGDYPTGIRFLNEAKQLDPNNLDVRFQLGVAHFSRQDYAAAEPEFQFVYGQNSRYENLGYYLGYVHYQRGDLQRALPLFQQNVSTDPQFRQLALYYAGLSLNRVGRAEEGARQFALSAQAAPASPLATAADRLARGVEAADRPDRRLKLEVKLAGLYDNNVTVAPNRNIFGLRHPDTSGRPDPRNPDLETLGNLFHVRGDYDVYRSANYQPNWNCTHCYKLTASYAFLQSLYYHNDRFNLADHIAQLQGVYTNTWRDMRYFTGLQYAYDFLTLGGRQFLQRHTVGPFFSLDEGAFRIAEATVNNLTQVRLQLQYKNFQTDPVITEENRDAFNYLVGATHFFRFEQDRHYIKVGFEFDKDAAAGFDYSYEGMKALFGFQATFPWDVRFRVDSDFHWRSYRGKNFFLSATPGVCTGPNDCVKRQDFEILLQASLAKDFGRTSKACNFGMLGEKAQPFDCFTVSLEFLSDHNRSRNTKVFEYTRQVLSVALGWRY